MPPVSPLLNATGLCSLSVKINGIGAPADFQVISVDIIHEKGNLATAGLKIKAGGSAANGLEDYDEVKPGNSISITVGYGNTTDDIFSGNIQCIEEDISDAVPATLTIHCAGAKPVNPPQPGSPVLVVTYGTDMRAFNAKVVELNKVTGTVSFQGSTLAKTGEEIAISNVGKTFSDNWLITKVTHHVSDGNWITTVGFGN